MSNKRVANNIDRDFPAYIYHTVGKSADCAEEKVKMYLEPYLKSDITDMIVNIFAQTSLYPSKVMTWTGAVTDRKIEDGIPVDYSDGWVERPTKDFYNNSKRDPVEIILTESKKAGKRAWISIRMNDVHGNQTPTNRMRGDLFYEVKKRGMFLDPAISGDFYKNCFDYSYEYVRGMMLDYIEEAVNRYEFDVLELDFTREIFCLDYNKDPECHKIMTEFICRVYEIIKTKDEGIKLAVRLCRDAEDALVFGFDVREWIKRGIIDIIIPSPRFRSTDSDMPIDRWLDIVGDSGVELHAGLEFFIHERVPNSLETLKGFITAYLDAGADMIYLYNFYREAAPVKDMAPWADKVGDVSKFSPYEETGPNDEYLLDVWRCGADVNEAKKGVRRNVMTFKEDSMTPKGERPYRPLPCKIEGTHDLTMQTGYLTDEKVTLILGVLPGEKIGRVLVDGKIATPLGKTNDSFIEGAIKRGARTALNVYEHYAFSVDYGSDRVRSITVEGDGITLGYLEFKIVAK